METGIDWNRILFNDLQGSFLIEVVFRTIVMFAFLLVALRFTGRRGVKQLSIFEVVIIIALGSAAGDPMFYEDVGIVPALLVFLVVTSFYRLVTWLTAKSRRVEQLMEGSAALLVEEGVFSVLKFQKEDMAQDEFFSELRLKSVEHLGQVKYAFLEPSGNISVFYFPDEQVRPGLPLLPRLYEEKSPVIPHDGLFSCANCGFTDQQKAGEASCPVCGKVEWVSAINTRRCS